MSSKTSGSRIIQIAQNVIGPGEPKSKKLKVRRESDFPGVPRVHLAAAVKYTDPMLLGPPLCDELIDLVHHMFTEEEAAVFLPLGLLVGKTARQIAKEARMPLETVKPLLTSLSMEKRFITRSGPEDNPKYRLLPLMPGVFELCLIRPSLDSLTDWHRRFAELIEALYETGYMVEHMSGKGPALVRYVPIKQSIDSHPMALPGDKFEMILDRYKAFGVGICQCRLTEDINGRGCGREKLNCAIMGEGVADAVKNGLVKEVTKAEMLAIKLEAEAQGMVNWMFNIDNAKTQSSCSCCGCCCHNLRTVTEFNVPSSIAPPHFLPKVDTDQCNYCGKCALNCPLAAITVNTKAKTYVHREERCIGCGLCVVACDQKKAITMVPVPDYKLPYRSWFSFISRAVPHSIVQKRRINRERRGAGGP
ncbi:MAG: 4Fe-4S binding protein [Deltaproteobacteria bacterium]|nr:4Fe-4S binding protein [Deltaproteobacteria bacterium]